ncbi:lycopene cyclase domain-containing protein [Nocardia xishanensis]
MAAVGYTLPAIAAVAVVCLVECMVLRTGLFGRPAYWLTMAIVLGFQIPVDGWLTKRDAPIVLYNPDHILGVRFPWNIPVEDFLFGFALVTAALLGWERARRREEGHSR